MVSEKELTERIATVRTRCYFTNATKDGSQRYGDSGPEREGRFWRKSEARLWREFVLVDGECDEGETDR